MGGPSDNIPTVPTMKDVVGDTIDRVAIAHGFRRQSGSWVRTSEELVSILDLQRSQFSRLYYLNLGWAILQLGNGTRRRINRCEVQLRLQEGAPPGGAELSSLLDLASPIPDEERRVRLSTTLEQTVIPFLVSVDTLEDLRTYVQTGRLSSAAIMGSAYELLGIQA